MYLDSSLVFAENLNIRTTANTSSLIGNVIDLGTEDRRIGSCDPMSVYISVKTAFAPSGATLSFTLMTSASIESEALSGTPTGLIRTSTYTGTQLARGQDIIIPVPSGSLVKYLRYLQLRVDGGATATTAGTIQAALVGDPQDWAATTAAQVPRL